MDTPSERQRIREAVFRAAEQIRGCCLCQGYVRSTLASAVADELIGAESCDPEVGHDAHSPGGRP